jgi:hypothetical protein
VGGFVFVGLQWHPNPSHSLVSGGSDTDDFLNPRSSSVFSFFLLMRFIFMGIKS